MDIDLEQHQVDLADTARRFFSARSTIGAVRAWEASEAGFAAELWAEMAGLGWLRLGHPESAGGVGGGVLELSVIYQAMGRALTPVPHLESAVIGAGVLAAAATRSPATCSNRSWPGRASSRPRSPRMTPASARSPSPCRPRPGRTARCGWKAARSWSATPTPPAT